MSSCCRCREDGLWVSRRCRAVLMGVGRGAWENKLFVWDKPWDKPWDISEVLRISRDRTVGWQDAG